MVADPACIVVHPWMPPTRTANRAKERTVRCDIIDLLANAEKLAAYSDSGFMPYADVLTVPPKPGPAIPRRLYLFGTGQPHTTTLRNIGLFIHGRQEKGGSAGDWP
ncbi:conserved hypothetical protein [Nitrospira sp. ND1]|nr:conserved hypothetical protein [Nitrospira sp. ND1]